MKAALGDESLAVAIDRAAERHYPPPNGKGDVIRSTLPSFSIAF